MINERPDVAGEASYTRLWHEFAALHRQIEAGDVPHLPTYCRTAKALMATVAAIVSLRKQARVQRPPRRARQCTGKFGYDSEAQALRALTPRMHDCEAYRCPYCDRWHLGHRRQRATRYPQLATCTKCQHTWVACWLPMALETLADLCVAMRCPMCGADANDLRLLETQPPRENEG